MEVELQQLTHSTLATRRIPAITDILDGKEIRVFESGSIMQYLVNRYDKDFKISYPLGTREHVEVPSSLLRDWTTILT